MKLSFGAICLLCISLLTSCNKSSPDNTPDPPPPVTVTITGVSPKTVTEGDTLTITGTSFGTDPAKVKVFFDYAGSSTSFIPIKVSPTQLTIVVPKSNSTALVPNPATCHPGIEVNGGDQIFSEVTFTYLYPAVYYTFSGVSARLGEFISLNGPFYKNQVADSIRVRFSGSNQWIRPIAGSDITYIDVREGYFYYKNVLIRVRRMRTRPSSASDLLAPGKTDSSLTVLPLLPDPTPGYGPKRRPCFCGTYVVVGQDRGCRLYDKQQGLYRHGKYRCAARRIRHDRCLGIRSAVLFLEAHGKFSYGTSYRLLGLFHWKQGLPLRRL